MAAHLHLLTGRKVPLAVTVMARQREAGHDVAAVWLGQAAAAPLPPGVVVHHAPAPLAWDALLDLILAADRVVTW